MIFDTHGINCRLSIFFIFPRRPCEHVSDDFRHETNDIDWIVFVQIQYLLAVPYPQVVRLRGAKKAPLQERGVNIKKQLSSAAKMPDIHRLFGSPFSRGLLPGSSISLERR